MFCFQYKFKIQFGNAYAYLRGFNILMKKFG